MFKVNWEHRGDHATFRTRWFETRSAAVRFALRKQIAVVFDPNGERIA